jgi:hypothetical protein
MMTAQCSGDESAPVRPNRQRCAGCRDLFPVTYLRRRGSALALWCDMCAGQTVLFPKPRTRSGAAGGGSR